MFRFIFLVVCCIVAITVNGDDPAPDPPNIIIKRYEMCPEFPNTPAKFKATIEKTTPMEFHINGEGETPYPMGDNIMLHFVAETFENDQWNQLIKLDEKDPCQLLNDYVADQWHALEKQMNIPVGVCPIAKGKYAVKDYKLDLNEFISAGSVPKGRLRFIANATQEEELVLCITAEFESL